MVSKLNPWYKLPARWHFTDYEIPQLYSYIKDSVIVPALKQAKFYAGTTDLWMSGSSDPYMMFTIHFIDSSWNLQSFCLDTVPLYADHTGQNIDAITNITESSVPMT